MAILVAGATGTVGSRVLHSLAGADADVRALTRTPDKAQLPPGVTAVQGEFGDVSSIRAAMSGVSTLFLVVANATDELARAMLTLNVARDAKVKGIVYLSGFKASQFADVPNFANKAAIEHMIDACHLPATLLRPLYYFQNDAVAQKDALLTQGIYGMPLGSAGLSLVDVRDVGEAAAKELLRREQSATPLPREAYALVGPDVLTGPDLASIWTDALDRPIAYGGDDLEAFAQRYTFVSPTRIYDIKMMMRRFQTDGAIATPAEIEKLTSLLGHPPRSYRDFAQETAAAWKNA